MRRIIVLIIVVALLLSGGFFFVRQRQQAAQQSALAIVRQATVERGRITATVNATGSIEPEALVSLTFGLAGTVQQINVARGQAVAAGDVLATLNTEELELAVRQAEDALRLQELTQQQGQNSQPSPATLAAAQADIDAAQAQVVVAQANLAAAEAAALQAQAQKAQLVAGSTAGQIAAAEAQVASARLQQKNAQEAHNRTLECFDVPGDEICPGLGAPEEQARANLENANAALSAAEIQLADLLAGPRPADIQAADAAIANAQAGILAAQGNVAVAEANLARAQAAYDRLLEPPGENELAIWQAQVDSARTNLALAQLRLEQAIIIAPMAGAVANVLVQVGEQATPGAPVMTVVNEHAFHINVNVDEIDIDQISLGQDVAITLDALPDTTVRGTIAEIAPTPINTSGVVTYLVTINLAAGENIDLRPGMSANASIVVEEVEDVLVVPNWAVRLDRETGEAFVNLKRADGTIEEVIVETGLRNEQFSEVVRGLAEGDVVAVTNEREVFDLFGG